MKKQKNVNPMKGGIIILKIKNNIDLKKLEKFGFKKGKRDNSYEYNESTIRNGFCGFVVYADDRKLYNFSSGSDTTLDIIYDLIKNNMIEKL